MDLRALVALVALVATACTSASAPSSAADAAPSPAASGATTVAAEPEPYPDAIIRRMRRLANEPRPVADSALPPRQLDTDRFPESLIPRDRIVYGGQPPDGIPAIDAPRFAAGDDIDFLDDREAVLVLRHRGEVRVYPIQIMIWHEIVNDRVGGTPIAVTYCPLCNSAVAFDRRVDGRVLDFGTSGALYQSAMVMYDRQTESLWTHFDGRAVVGTLVGAELELVPVSTLSWGDVQAAHPDARVLTRDTGAARPYGRNPYGAYDERDAPLTGYFTGDPDARAAAMRRVVGIGDADAAVAVPTDRVADAGVVATELDGRQLTVWHAPGTASALNDRDLAAGDDVGATGVFDARLDGEVLQFRRDGRDFVDRVTGSTWNLLGEAVDGPLAGRRLTAVPHLDTFWFAWATYRPGTTLLE